MAEPDNLKQHAASGTKWSAFSQIVVQALQFLTISILAVLLGADLLGLVGMAALVLGFLAIFNDMGIGAALIQRKELNRPLVASAFWANLSMGILLTTGVLLVAPLIAWFFEEPRLRAVVSVLSLNFILLAPSIVGRALLERDLNFKRLAVVDISAAVAGSVAGITSAVLGMGVWALVLQSLTTSVVNSSLTVFFSRAAYPFQLDFQSLRSLFGFSANLTGYSVFNYFTRNADSLLIGKYLGTESLGYYSLAYRLMLFPLNNISRVIGRVMYPVLSRVQDDNARFARAFLQMQSFIALVSFPLMTGLFLTGTPFVLTFWGAEWLPTAECLMILAPIGMTQPLRTMVGLIYKAKNRTDWMFWWGIVAGVVTTAAFVIGLQWGLRGILIAYAIISILLVYPSFKIPFTLIDLPFHKVLHAVATPFFGCVFMAVWVLLADWMVPDRFGNVARLAVMVPVGVVTYALFQWYANRPQIRQIRQLLLPAT